MQFRRSKITELDKIVMLIEDAKIFLKNCGVNQWQDGYPAKVDIANDIGENISYVLIDEKNIIGTASISFEKEITYDKIYEGNWISSDDYVVIHRVAIHNDFKRKGMFSVILKEAEKLALNKGVFSIKIDTHEDNIIMQNTLIKNGFKRCGIIYLEDGSKRIGFEKIIVNLV